MKKYAYVHERDMFWRRPRNSLRTQMLVLRWQSSHRHRDLHESRPDSFSCARTEIPKNIPHTNDLNTQDPIGLFLNHELDEPVFIVVRLRSAVGAEGEVTNLILNS